MVTAPVSPVFTFLLPLPWPLLLPHLHETQAQHHQWSVCFSLLDIHSLRFDRGCILKRYCISVSENIESTFSFTSSTKFAWWVICTSQTQILVKPSWTLKIISQGFVQSNETINDKNPHIYKS